MKKRRLFCLTILASAVFFVASGAEAGSLFHATRKAAARRIAAKGFSSAKMKSSARFGKGVYLSNSPSAARLEAKGADTVLRVRTQPAFDRRVVNLRNPKPSAVRALAPKARLRGTVKNGVIGPKLGHQLGRAAGRNGRIIQYRSVKVPGRSNFVIPRALNQAHPRLVKVTSP